MAKRLGSQRLITRNIGNLRGFSTDSIFFRPPNVADKAINIQKAPDGTLQLRRGYQCQIGKIGGMGIGTFDTPSGAVQTVCVGLDGFLYAKVEAQIFFFYNGRVQGSITNISNANPAIVTSANHGLITGAIIIIRNVGGMVSVNNATFTITVINPNTFSLNGFDSTLLPAYTTGGFWSILSADQRYLTFSIFVDESFIYAPLLQSINSIITVNRAAQIDGNQNLTNTITVHFGHQFVTGMVISFSSSANVYEVRNVLSSTSTTITIDGTAVSVTDGSYMNQILEIGFGKGFDAISPYTIAQFISAITDPVNGIYGLLVSANGITNVPAAFLQIFETVLIDTNGEFSIDYWYWQQVNQTTTEGPFFIAAHPIFLNSQSFENVSMTAFDDVIYMCDGLDFPQKYDGQTVYRVGMPEGIRITSVIDDTTGFISMPFATSDTYQYAITYEQVDNRGNVVEGVLSEVFDYTVGSGPIASDVTVTNLQSTQINNWNTNGALAVGGTATSYGPDFDGFYYDLVDVQSGFTLKIGDSAYYADITCAVMTGSPQTNTNTLNVLAGHGVLPGDTVYFFDSSNKEKQRLVSQITDTTITIRGAPVSVDSGMNPDILDYIVSPVFGNVAIIDGNQDFVNIINVFSGHTIQIGDVVTFLDQSLDLQRRNITGTSSTTITVDSIPVYVDDLFLISSENQRADAINLQRLNANPATLTDGTPGGVSNAISNNLRINIYRTKQGEQFSVDGKLYLISSIPNDSSGNVTQLFVDGLPDTELSITFSNPFEDQPNPPPISKYVKGFGNQLFYAGGERGNSENSDRVFFSDGNSPETLSLSRSFFNVPSIDDEITGIGIAGSSLVITKNRSLWSASGNFVQSQVNIIQIAPGTNIGCVANATIASVGTLMYFLHSNGLYAITENQLFPTDSFGNPIPLSIPIDVIFRERNYFPANRYVLKRATAVNYTKENQYLLFLPCEDPNQEVRTENKNSIILCYDYEHKNWFLWTNMNAAGGMIVMDDNLYFQERRFSTIDGNTANLYKQHRFYRLIDHADHAGAQYCEWLSSWEDLEQPEVRKKFSKCILLMDRISELFQFNNPVINFSSYVNRIPDLPSTQKVITQVFNDRNSHWSTSPWSFGRWSGYQDSFIEINLKQGTVAKSMQVGFKIQGINMDIRLAGFQLEIIPENRMTVVR